MERLSEVLRDVQRWVGDFAETTLHVLFVEPTKWLGHQAARNLVKLFVLIIALPPAIVTYLTSQYPSEVSGVVVGVRRADEIRIEGFQHTVRIFDVELRRGQRFSELNARKYLIGLVKKQRVHCQQVQWSPYWRYVADCKLNDGRDVATELVAAGFADRQSYKLLSPELSRCLKNVLAARGPIQLLSKAADYCL